VLNAATGEYLQNAEVDVTSANISVYTGGRRQLPHSRYARRAGRGGRPLHRPEGLPQPRHGDEAGRTAALDVEMAPLAFDNAHGSEKAITVVGSDPARPPR
jgi:hypothetical protein